MNPELLINEHCKVGENPLWDERRYLLFWCDIPNGKIWSFDPRTGTHRKIYEDKVCGAFTIQENGDLLLLRSNEMARLNVESGEITVLQENFTPSNGRFNDCLADAKGRVFSGTQEDKGRLYRIETDGIATPFGSESGCSNGLGFMPDEKQIYWSDSTASTVWRFDYDAQTGGLSNQTTWLETPGNIPDGLVMDSEGAMWLAFWDLHCLRHYSPDAKLLEEIVFPVKHVTAAIFGGENLDELYVTTASNEQNDQSLSGALFRLKVPVGGKNRHRSRILL